MEVNGYDIKEKIKELIEQEHFLKIQFETSVYTFENEQKKNPLDIAKDYLNTCERITKLQCLQQQYNLFMSVLLEPGELNSEISLAEAVKKVSQIDCMRNMWKSTTSKKNLDIYGRSLNSDKQRSKDIEVATRQISEEDSIIECNKYTKVASNLRKAIAIANAKYVKLGESPFSNFSSDLFL